MAAYASTLASFLLLISLPELELLQRVATLGINYGQVSNSLPSPKQVLMLLASTEITKVRIYDTNPQVLATFANSSIELIVTLPNEMVTAVTNPQEALQWATDNIKSYFPSTKITGIAIGNEIFTGDDPILILNLVPAMASIHGALVQLGLDSHIHVSTANSLAVLGSSYPPSAGEFRSDLADVMRQLLQFLQSTGSPFWINSYPFFAYKDDPTRVSLDYVLFNPNSGTEDPSTQLYYNNMLYAQVDAVIFAMEKMGFKGLEVAVSETGWPSNGDPDEFGATIENAGVYNKNLLQRQEANEGTPLRPKQRLEVYLFALFNEDMKPGAASERNYGLYQANGTMAYNIGLNALSCTSHGALAKVPRTSSASKVRRTDLEGSGCWAFLNLFILHAIQRSLLELSY